MNTRNRKSRRPVVSKNFKRKTSSIAIQSGAGPSFDSETHTMEGSLDDFEEIQVPSWMEEMFAGNNIGRAKLTQVYTTYMGLHQLQQRNVLCDVNIKVGDSVFHAHKNILAASSRFFRTMFTSGFQESREPDVSITGKPGAFKIILNYIYSCELTLTLETVVDVLEMSHYLQLDLVMKRCEELLIDELNSGVELDTEAAVRSLTTARMYGLEVLTKVAKRCIAQNFEPTDNFLCLMTAELLEDILGENYLKDEKKVFDTILAWLQHDWTKRKKFAPALLRKIRLGIVPLGYLSMTLLKYPKLYAITECRELIDKALQMFDVRKTGDAPLHFKEPELFATRTMMNAVLSIDTNCGKYYDTDSKQWTELAKFPLLPEKDNSNNGDTCLSMDGHLYVSRGTNTYPKKLKCPQFLRLDMPNNRWVSLRPMPQRKQDSFLVAGNGLIYAVGGDVDYNGYFSIEVYNIESNIWGSLPLPASRDEYYKPTIESCKVYQDKLLMYYGQMNFPTDRHTAFFGLKMYDPASKVWTKLLGDVYHKPQTQAVIGLIINDDKCYRIFCCKCDDNDCQSEGIDVEEIVIDFEGKTARIGEKQEQDLITSNTLNEKKMAFLVNQDVYVIVNKQFFKTGIKIARNRTDPLDLSRWNNLKHVSSRQSVLLTQVMFDKKMWL